MSAAELEDAPLWRRTLFRYSLRAMGHRLLLCLLAVVALAMIALSLVWPQGMGRPSPAPFGHSSAGASG